MKRSKGRPKEPDLLMEPQAMFAERQRLGDLIETATTSPLLHLDDRVLSSVKSLVRASDDNVRCAFDCLLDRLKKNHAQVRYLAVLVTDELFKRSKHFRSLLVPIFETFILLSVGFRADYPLPPPEDRASLLRKKSLEIVERWNDVFGQHYKPIRLGYDYLKKTLRFEFPNAREVATLAAQQRRDREERTQELLRKKLQTLVTEYPHYRSEVQLTIDEIDECLAMLAPSNSSPVVSDLDEDEGFEEYGVESLRLLRNKKTEQPNVPPESRHNSAVFDTIRDLYKILSRHLVSSQEHLTTLMKVDPEDNRQSRDAVLRDIIDLRNLLLKTREKCEGLGILRIMGSGGLDIGEDLDEVIWEEGDVLTNAPSTKEVTGLSIPAENLITGESVLSDIRQEKECQTEELKVVGIRQDLLKQAPVLPYGSFLDTWGSQSAVPANQRGLDYENHWGKVNYDVMIPADKIAELNIRASYYKALEVEIRPCLAPLRKGGLCQRRDLRRCPLHGPVIQRDEKGNPVGEDAEHVSSRKGGKVEVTDQCISEIRDGEVNFNSLSAHHAQLAEQAIGNVRKKDVAAKTLAQRQRGKRAREHNDACLRDAAMARRNMGFGEGLDIQSNCLAGAETRELRGGLTALLRKKPTSKDRLARRLLSGRVRDATVSQLARDEEAAYRESFPNQW